MAPLPHQLSKPAGGEQSGRPGEYGRRLHLLRCSLKLARIRNGVPRFAPGCHVARSSRLHVIAGRMAYSSLYVKLRKAARDPSICVMATQATPFAVLGSTSVAG